MVFIAAQVVAHDLGEEINHLMDLLTRHAGNQLADQAIIAALAKKDDQRLLVCGAIESENHGMSVCGWWFYCCNCQVPY